MLRRALLWEGKEHVAPFRLASPAPVSNLPRYLHALGVLLAIWTAVTVASLNLPSHPEAASTSALGVIAVVFWLSWFAIRLWEDHQQSPLEDNHLSMMLATRSWLLTCGLTGVTVMATLSLPVSWLALVVLLGWIGVMLFTLALNGMMRPGDRDRDASGLALANDVGPHPLIYSNDYRTIHSLPTTLSYSQPVDQAARDMLDGPGKPTRESKVSPSNRPLGRLSKRTVDLIGATVGILALLPVLVACALAVKLTSRGPVFFRQKRIGKDGLPFTCLKFRSMRSGAQDQLELLRPASIQDGPAFKMPNDPRITWVGKYLRKYSLDELPQILNVLWGDMSLVGPRPPVPSEVLEYDPWQRRRISIKPGLTCIWQVWGRNQVSFNRWVEMDLDYIDNWSLWLDFKLIARTIPAMLKGTGM